jgi:HSP20 family protein
MLFLELIMSLITRNFDSIFDDFFPSVRTAPEANNGHMIPRVDIEENEKSYLITADLPGIKKEDLNVELNNGMLTIRAQHDETSEEKKEGVVIRRERRTGSYSRSFNVGKGITEEDIKGDFVNGVLKLTVPKASQVEPQTKRIQIN